MLCSVDECSREVRARGWCAGHYHRWERGVSFDVPLRVYNPGAPCSFSGCKKKSRNNGFCIGHYSQHKKGKGLTPLRYRGPNGVGWITGDGYRMFTVEGGRALEHRLVMEQQLGRELLPGENVHHINGERLDNRPENLELWITYQPPGQRPEDLLAYAYEIIERYGAA